jgi:hypothetical protein
LRKLQTDDHVARRHGDFEKMSYAELAKMQVDVERMKAEKQASERSALKQKLEAIAKVYVSYPKAAVGKEGKDPSP